MAVMAGVESAVQIHIERGDNLNSRDAGGMTPLMLSAARNKASICRLLLKAGADPNLHDPSGRTALQIAVAAGAKDAAEILGATSILPTSVPQPLTAPDPVQISVALPNQVGRLDAAKAEPSLPEAALAQSEPQYAPEPPTQPDAVADEAGDGEFDLSGWEAEEEPVQPELDLVVVASARAVQVEITSHQPIDSSAEWDDVDAYLPDIALPLARADDTERRAQLRCLLLRGVREGSVPALDVQALSTNEDRSANPEAARYLAMVINDLGAEVDERFEYSDAHESFEVFVDPAETLDEEAALDEALVAIDSAASPRHEPLRIYQREFQRLRLLTAEEEIQLAKDMEAALDAALDALATWPEGIERTLAACAAAIAGSRRLSSVWLGGEPEPEPASAERLEAGALAPADSEHAADEDDEPLNEEPAAAGEASFAEALRRLSALVGREGGPRASLHEVRTALASLRLNRHFLLELIDAAESPAPCPEFQSAMADFRKARDRMTTANLKLSFFHAKKYLHSGEPLDDLAQEGNIGLLKAVDRYDWRRGFRFSTYATWWIRQQIGRHVADKVRTIRLPLHLHEKLQRAERMAKSFEGTVSREPTLDELAERLEIPRQRLATLLRIAPEPICIDEATIDGMIAIDARDAYLSPDPAEVVDEILLNQAVDRYVSSLSTKDRKEERILRMRFGIGVDEVLTLDEVGMRFDVTRERIRQIEAKAIKKLRHPSRSEPFARMVLGLEPEENPLAPAPQTPQASDTPNAAVRQAPSSPPREPVETADGSKPSALDRLLAQASLLGIRVDDDRLESGRIWVDLVEAQDNKQRRLVRQLLEFGFAFWPGKGYWR